MLGEFLWNALFKLDFMINTLHQILESESGLKLKIRINDNHSTMLSVKWEPDQVRISLHRMFLEAPHNVMQELACYIKAGRHKIIPKEIKKFIEYQTQKIDCSQSIKKKCLISKGNCFDLQKIYHFLNGHYFNQKLELFITWYGQGNRPLKSQINFGLYSFPLKLIKIHRLLDSIEIPEFVVHFVVYHEMLHSVCTPFVNQRGMTIVHTPEFKKREREFQFFQDADRWIKQNKNRFFR